MGKKACVFVDGESFRHSIVDLFEQFKSYDYLPKADWDELFDYFVRKAIPRNEYERVRTYWYVIDLLDFYPYRFPDADSNTEDLQQLLSRNKQIKKKLQKLQDKDALIAGMKEVVINLTKSKKALQSRFQGWKTVQDNISVSSSRVEFRRAGAITYNLLWERFGKEKAVDVKLAVDLIGLREIYDLAVIISGDQDYVPAVQVVKDFGKTVVNVAFRTKDEKLLPGGAWRLNQHTDDNIEIPYNDLAKYLNIPGMTTPELPLEKD